MDEGIKFKVNLSLEDYRNFNYSHIYSGNKGRFIIIVNALLLIFSLLLIPSALYNGEQIPMTAWIALFMPFLYLIILPVMIFFSTKRAFKTDKFLSEEQNYAINNQNIEITTVSSKVNIGWDKIYLIKERKNYIFVYIARTKALIMPKRNMIDSLNNIKKIYADNIDKKKLKIKYS
jgi:hypothetical protein